MANGYFPVRAAHLSALFWRWAQLYRGGRQVAHPDQVVGSQREGEHPSDPLHAAMASLAQAADRLEPTEYLLDAFAFLLTNRIARMTSSARIDNSGRFERDMRGYPVVAHLLNKLLGVVRFVAAYGNTVLAKNFLHHCHCGLDLRASLGQGDARVNRQAVAVLHQYVARIAKLGFLARPFACQPCVGVGGRLVSVVAAPLTVEVNGGIARVIGRLLVRAVLALEAFVTGPGLNQSAVNCEVLTGEQCAAARLCQHLSEQSVG